MAAPLTPQDADIIAAVAALRGNYHGRHFVVTDCQAWCPGTVCAHGATDGGLSLAQLCPVAYTKPIRPPAGYTTRSTGTVRAHGDAAHRPTSKKTAMSHPPDAQHRIVTN